ncbi:ABC-F family ATP-binding cassette domain-containing protein [Pseudomonas purpurea]|uniref:ABC-F family ATP-binding cassette domain-containing protein n=1 Tax=Pseudomonas purpurea TaxID=3136737 RepID=UPI0032647CF0
MTHVTRLPALVTLNQLTFQFANGETLFDSLNLSLDRRPTGIVGRNGSGKSVLARLIAGELSPSSGNLKRYGSVAYVAQEHACLTSRSVAQVAGVADTLDALTRLNQGHAASEDLEQVGDRWDLPERLRRSLDEAGLQGLEAHHPAQPLSGGQLARVALIGALLSRADLLVLDEPTNHLDAHGREWLVNQLAGWRGGLTVVSHDRQLLNGMQRIVELSELGLRTFGGNHEAFRAQCEVEQNAALAALEQARAQRGRELKRLQREHDTIQRRAAGSRRNAETANVSRIERASMKGAATEIMGHVRPAHQAHKSELDTLVREANARVAAQEPVLITLPATAVPESRQVVSLIDAQLPWLAPEQLSTYLNLTISGPMRIAVSGPNGCGKSTLLKLLAQITPPSSGQCLTHVPCAYLDQQLVQLDDQRSIIEQLEKPGSLMTEGTLRTRLAQLQLDARQVTQPCGSLSGGERLKAALAIAVWKTPPAQLLLLDEPTNHLDLASVQAVEQALRGFPGAMVVASHDQAFLAALSPTHTLTWQPDGWRLENVNV